MKALERLRADLTIRGASLSHDSPVRAAVEKTLSDLRTRVDADPACFEQLLRDALRLLGPQGAPDSERCHGDWAFSSPKDGGDTP